MSTFWNNNGQWALRHALWILYVLVSPLVFLGSYHFIGDLLDFSHFGFLLPPYIGYVVLPIYLLVVLYLLAFPGERTNLRNLHLIHGAVLAGLGAFLIVLVSSYILSGFYWSPVMGTVNDIFPIDLIVYGALAMLLGGFLLAQPLLPGSDLSSWKRKQRGRGFWPLLAGGIFYSLIALYLLGALFSGVDFANWFSEAFLLMFPSYFMMLLATLLLVPIIYRDEVLGGRPTRKGSLAIKIVPGILVGVGLVLLITTNLLEPNLYVMAGKPYFPIDFEGSLNVAPVVLSLFPVLALAFILVRNWRTPSKDGEETQKE